MYSKKIEEQILYKFRGKKDGNDYEVSEGDRWSRRYAEKEGIDIDEFNAHMECMEKELDYWEFDDWAGYVMKKPIKMVVAGKVPVECYVNLIRLTHVCTEDQRAYDERKKEENPDWWEKLSKVEEKRIHYREIEGLKVGFLLYGYWTEDYIDRNDVPRLGLGTVLEYGQGQRVKLGENHIIGITDENLNDNSGIYKWGMNLLGNRIYMRFVNKDLLYSLHNVKTIKFPECRMWMKTIWNKSSGDYYYSLVYREDFGEFVKRFWHAAVDFKAFPDIADSSSENENNVDAKNEEDAQIENIFEDIENLPVVEKMPFYTEFVHSASKTKVYSVSDKIALKRVSTEEKVKYTFEKDEQTPTYRFDINLYATQKLDEELRFFLKIDTEQLFIDGPETPEFYNMYPMPIVLTDGYVQIAVGSEQVEVYPMSKELHIGVDERKDFNEHHYYAIDKDWARRIVEAKKIKITVFGMDGRKIVLYKIEPLGYTENISLPSKWKLAYDSIMNPGQKEQIVQNYMESRTWFDKVKDFFSAFSQKMDNISGKTQKK